MKVTMQRCTRCARRDHFSRPRPLAPCPECGAPTERTSRLALGRWHRDDVALRLIWGARADLDHHRLPPAEALLGHVLEFLAEAPAEEFRKL